MDPSLKYHAVLFDLDGTILMNEADFEWAFANVFEKEGLVAQNLMRMGNGWLHEPGTSLQSNWKRILSGVEGEFSNEDVEIFARETWQAYVGLQKDMEQLQIRDGVDEVIEVLQEKEIRTGLCTGSIWSVVERELELLQLHMAFEVTTTGEEVVLPKPDPEIYLLACQKIGVEPNMAMVVEDAIAGMRAGVEAGCKTFGFVSEYADRATIEAVGATPIEDIREILDVLY